MSKNNNPLTASQLISHETIDLSDDYEYDEQQWYQDYSNDMYYMYIHEMASKGFYTPSIADQMQSLGTRASTIGTRLSFQMYPTV